MTKCKSVGTMFCVHCSNWKCCFETPKEHFLTIVKTQKKDSENA